jgi:predicted glycogen debranching enzyme
VHLDRDALLDLERSARLRWLLADGRGGWSGSTVLGAPASRWDGLLVVADPASDLRWNLLSRFEETLVFGEHSFPLSVARYRGTLHPEGWKYLWSFDAAPYPRWTYRIGHVEVVREILRPRGADAVLVRWTVRGNEAPVTLRLRPFLPFRSADLLTFENAALDPHVEVAKGGVAFRPYPDLPRLRVAVAGAAWSFVPGPLWYRGIELADDLRRGEAGHEDSWSPGELTTELKDGASLTLSASAGDTSRGTKDPARAFEDARRAAGTARPGLRDALERSADAFLVHRGGRHGVIAGFPWFREWGRDTFLSLPGLLLARGRVEECGEALLSHLPYLRADGRMPNRFGPTPEASDYKAIDAGLWFALAVERWDAAGGKPRSAEKELVRALARIADALLTLAGAETLLRDGSAQVASTWMDAVVEGRAVTPRNGQTVEVNALWYSLLDFLAEKAEGRAERTRRREQAQRVADAFLARLWRTEDDRLADQFLDRAPDRSVRPNMVLAASLARSPLHEAQRRAVLACTRRELVTPRGLRTLSPKDPAYVGHYRGRIVDRDRAYHQGTVWPWLAGAFVEASLRADGRGAPNLRRLREWVEGFGPAVSEWTLGHVAEVYDGDPPHGPSGTWAQAWSTAELLRACELLGIR